MMYAPASLYGSFLFRYISEALIDSLSMNSRQVGIIPAVMILGTTLIASCISLKGISSVATCLGSGINLSQILVITPKVPSEPTNK
ncbi:hypothetical protein SDC9_89521 [bioreactor metagenome]|uniref:Uncharacterized protein n=1 Tax=bioreactor metagenome TaxID=1076179 RepID=A0A644ZPF9_9ZZZZ